MIIVSPSFDEHQVPQDPAFRNLAGVARSGMTDLGRTSHSSFVCCERNTDWFA